MIILILFAAIPFLIGLLIEYIICRFVRRNLWRGIPPLVITALGVGVAFYRYRMWSSDTAVWTQLLFVPGLPAVLILLGMLVGWRLGRRFWRPRVIWEKKKR